MRSFVQALRRPFAIATAATMAVTAPVVVSIPAQRAQEDNNEAGGLAPLAHHKKKGGFVNPWDSFTVSLLLSLTIRCPSGRCTDR